MNSSLAPFGPRTRNSLMIRVPAASAVGMATVRTIRAADAATNGNRTDLRISCFLSYHPRAPSSWQPRIVGDGAPDRAPASNSEEGVGMLARQVWGVNE